MAHPTPIEKMNYEAAYAELDEIVNTLEQNQPALEEALALFERGEALAARCAALLDQAELKVRQLTKTELAGPEVDEA
jgi:exodeoxyribonuclease VII small subunit